MLNYVFGPPQLWPDQDLIGFAAEFDPELVVSAYRSGVFPMPLSIGDFGGEMGWWAPTERGIIPLDGLRVTRSLRQSARHYTSTIDTAFDQVIAECANPARPGGWIDPDVIDVFTTLHHEGIVHSVEIWDYSGRLAGGLYGVSIGGLFAGESMFHHSDYGRDASKVALMRLVYELNQAEARLLDVQWSTAHLEKLGAISIERAEYLELLEEALICPELVWPKGDASILPGHQLTQYFRN